MNEDDEEGKVSKIDDSTFEGFDVEGQPSFSEADDDSEDDDVLVVKDL